LRQDNADERLTPKGYDIGLVSEKRWHTFNLKYSRIKELINFCNISPVKTTEINDFLRSKRTSEIKQTVKLNTLILRPQVNIFDLCEALPELKEFCNSFNESKNEVCQSAEIKIKYDGYIEREKIIAEKIKRLENIKIHNDFDYEKLNSLSTEARQKMKRIKPETIGQAARIPGVSPSDINVLLVFFGR
jgi:tRNA uridine 5-carboxymethylaminomethyl modification enzyme